MLEDLLRELARRMREEGRETASRLPPGVAEELKGGFADAVARLFAWLRSLQRAGVAKPLPEPLKLLAALCGAMAAKALCDAAAALVEEGVEPAEALDEALDLVFTWRMKLAAAAALLGGAEGGGDG